jgi:hypothetical protein
MGCKTSKESSSSEEQESEQSNYNENGPLLPNGVVNGNGYGIERLPESPPPVPLRRGGGNHAPSALPDRHTAYPVQEDSSPLRQKAIRSNGVRTEVLRSSQGSSVSDSSLSRHTELLPGRVPQHVAVGDSGRQWGGGYAGLGQVQQQTNGQLAGYASNTNGHARTEPYAYHINNYKRTALKLGGPVQADGPYQPPRSPVIIHGKDSTKTRRGKELMEELSKAYKWRERFEYPAQEFLGLMDHLYMECQLHLTALSSQDDLESRREADAIVSEMVALRNHWGPQLLPSSTCNAFVRERIPLTLGVDQRQFRIDCAQFFEPVPFYGNQRSSSPGELMKLYRFSVYNVDRNEVVLRYYLERSNVIQLYHVLCFTCENYRGQVRPYGTEPPSYWEVRQNMLADVYTRLLSGISPSHHQPPKPQTISPSHHQPPKPQTISPSHHQPPKPQTIYPPNTMGRPAHLQVMPVVDTT